jgi:hypothetical protein
LEACRAENGRALAESDWENAGSLQLLQQEDGVEVLSYPEDILQALRATTGEVLLDTSRQGSDEQPHLSEPPGRFETSFPLERCCDAELSECASWPGLMVQF